MADDSLKAEFARKLLALRERRERNRADLEQLARARLALAPTAEALN